MRRAAIERPRTLRVWKAHRLFVHEGRPTACLCDEQPGRFRKGQRVGGCPLYRCSHCRGHKLYQMPTLRDYRAALSYREWARELGFRMRMPRKHGRFASGFKRPDPRDSRNG
jgi:hypothetical protein